MRAIYYILLSFLLWACNSGTQTDTLEKMEAEEAVSVSEADMSEETTLSLDGTLLYDKIITQKLQEYVDLQNLLIEHPEFRGELQKSLEQLARDSLIFSANEAVTISDITRMDDAEIVSDSLKRIPFSFNIVTESGTRKDSLIAVIRTKTVQIDGVNMDSYKISFEPQ
ncbi:hypothetical protein [Pukyongia salina]|uniref:hypothetical protein n=1 Tax=Pukyongia salina TaxID=2094025 RepID=UPI00131A0B23|nr:hypothetical protein [Pukyongia salina]